MAGVSKVNKFRNLEGEMGRLISEEGPEGLFGTLGLGSGFCLGFRGGGHRLILELKERAAVLDLAIAHPGAIGFIAFGG